MALLGCDSQHYETSAQAFSEARTTELSGQSQAPMQKRMAITSLISPSCGVICISFYPLLTAWVPMWNRHPSCLTLSLVTGRKNRASRSLQSCPIDRPGLRGGQSRGSRGPTSKPDQGCMQPNRVQSIREGRKQLAALPDILELKGLKAPAFPFKLGLFCTLSSHLLCRRYTLLKRRHLEFPYPSLKTFLLLRSPSHRQPAPIHLRLPASV